MDRYILTKKVALMGIMANMFLLAIKLLAGFLSRSQAMIADGFNSAGDVFSSVMTYIGNRIASKPEDKTHPYGHGKAEYIFSMIISFSLLLVAYKILHGSLNSIFSGVSFTFSWWLVVTALSIVIIKLALYIYTSKAGKKEDNLLILANSEDHRNDVFVTTSTLLGIMLGTKGIYWVDGIVGMGISLWIGYTGLKIFTSSYNVLMDKNMDTTLSLEVSKTVESIDRVDHIDEITAKPIGVNYIIIVKVSVQGNMTVNESHGIAALIREKVRKLDRVGDVVVHINPV